MKKVVFVLIILSVLLTLSYSQSITVTRPSAGETVNKEEVYVVRWTTEGTLHASVKIRLFDRTGASKIMDITNRTETAAGRYRCPATLFNSVPNGSYIVRVKTLDDQYSGNSGVFILGNPGVEPDPDPPPPEPERDLKSIRVVTPNGGRSLAQNSTIRILWRCANLTNNVTISLLKNDMVFGTIVTGLAPGRISHDWKIGQTTLETALPDSGFKIRIDEEGSGIFDVSDSAFTIEPERNIDLSCYIGEADASRLLKRVTIVVKVRCKNFPGVLNDVPVKIMLKKKSDGTICTTTTKTIPELSYRGHSYEYTVNARLSYRRCITGISILNKMEVVAIVDPDDIFRDRSRLNNTSKKDVK